ncbi:hypothetical protein V8C34DRAFT_239426 [Trichoderma compactum]
MPLVMTLCGYLSFASEPELELWRSTCPTYGFSRSLRARSRCSKGTGNTSVHVFSPLLPLSHGGDLMMSDLTIRQISVDRTKAGLRAEQCAERQMRKSRHPTFLSSRLGMRCTTRKPFIQQTLSLDYVKSIHLMSVLTLPANQLRLEI